MPTSLDYREINPLYTAAKRQKSIDEDEDAVRAQKVAQAAQQTKQNANHLAVAPYELQTHQDAAEKSKSDSLARTLSGDVGESVAAYPGVPFRQLPAEQQQSYTDRYKPVAGQIAPAWDAAQTARTGAIPGLEHPEKYQKHISIAPTGEASTTLYQKPDPIEQPIPAKIRSELMHAGKYRADMTPDEASGEYEQMQTDQGVIPEHLRPFAEKLASQLVRHPILAPFAKQKEAYDTMKSGFEHPESGGFGDMAMIEGFQRIVNPGAVVRQQTMNQMLAAAGLDKYGSWDFFKNKIAQGDKLGPDARKRLMDLAEQTFAHAKTTASRELESKRRYAASMGIPNPNAFVDNILDYIAQTGEAETTATQKPATPAPEGAAAYLKQHPETASAFDAKYGAGSSASILGK